MRITIVQGAFLPVPPLLGGAVEKMWFELGRAFAGLGHEVTHVSRLYPGLAEEEVVSGVRYLRIRGFATPGSLVVLKCLDFYYSLLALRRLPDADVLVSNTFFMPILCRNIRKGQIYVDMQRFPKGQVRCYSRAARLRANSSAIERAIIEERPQMQSRVRMIPNPLPFVPGSVDLDGKEKLILYAGRLHPEKGVHLLLKAFKRMLAEGHGAGWTLEVAGPWETALGGGGKAYWQELLQLAEGLPVCWHGMIGDRDELNAVYRRASVFAYPSLADKGETFGLSILEAMSWGCVPVVSALDCFTDFVKDRVNGIVFDHRAEDPVTSLCRALKIVLADQPLRNRMQQMALGVRKSHALEMIAYEFLADFESLLGQRPS